MHTFKASRPSLILAILILALMAAILGVSTWLQYSARDWPSTQGSVVRVWQGRRYWRVEYRYSVDGRPFTSTRMYLGLGVPVYAKNYHAGDPVTVYYNPVSPGDAVLSKEVWPGGIVVVLAMIGVGAAVVWYAARQNRSG